MYTGKYRFSGTSTTSNKLTKMQTQKSSFQGIFGCFRLILERNDPIYHVQTHLLRVPSEPVQYPQCHWVQNFILEGV